MKLSKVFLSTLLIVSTITQVTFSQNVDVRNNVEFMDGEEEVEDLNSIKAFVKLAKKDKVIKTHKEEKKPQISIEKKTLEASIDDLQKMVSKRNDLRFRKKRSNSEKCVATVKKTPCAIKDKKVNKNNKEARIAAKKARIRARKNK